MHMYLHSMVLNLCNMLCLDTWSATTLQCTQCAELLVSRYSREKLMYRHVPWIIVAALVLVNTMVVVQILLPSLPLGLVQRLGAIQSQYQSDTSSSKMELRLVTATRHNMGAKSVYRGAELPPVAVTTPSVRAAHGVSPQSWPDTCGGRRLTAGYVLALRDWEQQTAGSANLMSLQCWAATLNMAVVEYFMPTSQLGVPHELLVNASTARPQEFVRLGDVYDLDYWNHYSVVNCYAPLVRCEEFLNNAPREVILVHMKYSTKPWDIVKSCPPQDEYSESFRKVHSPFFEAHDFKAVREICLDTTRNLSTRALNSFILGNRTDNVTVMINAWGGVTPGGVRFNVPDSNCHRDKYLNVQYTKASTKLLDDVRAYREQVLRSEDYVAVMVRLQFTLNKLLVDSPRGNWSIFKCFKGISSVLTETKLNNNLKETFWSLDVGKYGSIEYQWIPNIRFATDEVLAFMNEYQHISYTDVEESLIEVSGTSNAGYIASLQRNIAVRAKCLLLIGGGSFQENANKLYRALHQGTECVVTKGAEWLVEQCS